MHCGIYIVLVNGKLAKKTLHGSDPVLFFWYYNNNEINFIAVLT